MMDPYATTHRRLKQIQGHFMTPQSLRVLPQFTLNSLNNKSNISSMWRKLTTSSRLGAISIPPLTAYYIFKLFKGKHRKFINDKDIEIIIKEISGNDIFDQVVKLASKVIGFLGVIQISNRMETHLGVKLTFSKSYQLLVTLSSILDTILSFTKLTQKWGIIFCIVSILYCIINIRMLYLTLAHNKTVERLISVTRTKCQGFKMNIPALGAWGSVVAITLYIWLKEAKKLAQSTGGILTMTAFLLSAIAAIRVGLRAAMTSFPGLTPFEGSSAVAIAIILGALPLIPYYTTSEWSRTLLSGYLSIVISMIINSFFAWKTPSML
ncbi:hypothetical protein ACTFIV_009529 [Dictyostelium citrinum]